ncbi:MAG: hypothetical protein IMF19_10645 [Proteobacteria bacterium]|nr:hypothetical protein [Pseudomonadota bacterium]
MTREKEKKRGPKYPVNVAKKLILNIALDYPDGISEDDLIEKIQEELGLSNRKGIKEHLGDLGPGRVVKGNWKEGKEYLIKIPSKYDSKFLKRKIMSKLATEGLDLDINALPEISTWKPNPSPKVSGYIYKTMMKGDFESAYYKLYGGGKQDEERQRLAFLNTKYVQRVIDTYFLPLFKTQYDIPSIEDGLPKGVMAFIDSGFKLSPTAVSSTIFHVPEVNVTTGLMLFGIAAPSKKDIDKSSVAIATLYTSLLIDMAKYCTYPGMEEKISTCLDRSNSALSDWFGLDLTNLRHSPKFRVFAKVFHSKKV